MTLRKLGLGLAGLSLIVNSVSADLMSCFDKVNKIKYVAEAPFADYWQTPKETETLGTGDCEDMAFYLSSLLDKDNVTNRVVIGLSHNGAKQLHAWVEAKHGDTFYIIDCTAGLMIERGRLGSLSYIEIPALWDKECSKAHESYEKRLEETK